MTDNLSRLRPVRPVVAVAAIIFSADQVLLIRRGKPPGVGLWTVPGGGVEIGETLAAACAREVKEETGLEVKVGKLVEVVERVSKDEGGEILYHYIILDFLAEVVGGMLQAGSDVSDARFFAWPELKSLTLTDGLVPVLLHGQEIRSRG